MEGYGPAAKMQNTFEFLWKMINLLKSRLKENMLNYTKGKASKKVAN